MQEFQTITINEEISIVLIAYNSGTNSINYSLQDYFEPSKFKDTDLVQTVTFEFLDK